MSGQTGRIASVGPSKLVVILARLTVFATFLLLIAGALVTGNKAAMADPTWPKFVGSWVPLYWVGGLLYEDSHRIVAGTVGILMLALAIVIQIRERNWSISPTGVACLSAAAAQTLLGATMIYLISHEKLNVNYGLSIHIASMLLLTIWFLRLLFQRSISDRSLRDPAWFGVWLVINQALLGGLVIHSIRTPIVSMVHGFVAQAFFCTVIAIAAFAAPSWIRSLDDEQLIRPENEGFRKLTRFVTAVSFIQVVLGTGVRHTTENFVPYLLLHIGMALFLIMSLGWFAMRVYHVYRDVSFLRRNVHHILGMIGIQVVLGVCSAYSNRARLKPEMAHWWDVTVTTLHLVVGALILGTLFAACLHIHRRLGVAEYAGTAEIKPSEAVGAS